MTHHPMRMPHQTTRQPATRCILEVFRHKFKGRLCENFPRSYQEAVSLAKKTIQRKQPVTVRQWKLRQPKRSAKESKHRALDLRGGCNKSCDLHDSTAQAIFQSLNKSLLHQTAHKLAEALFFICLSLAEASHSCSTSSIGATYVKPTKASSGSSTLALKNVESADLPTDPVVIKSKSKQLAA